MNIVIPMTGMGRRFLEAGYKDPKPLISIAGKPMIEHVLDMYHGAKQVFFICNNEHLRSTPMRSVLTRIAPIGHILGIDKTVWDGPVPDILKVQDIFPNEEPVLVSYCDFTVFWDFADFQKTLQEGDYDGAIIAYRGLHPHHCGPTYYGYMRVDENRTLLEIKEKEAFTENRSEEFAAAGSYYFKNGALMKRYFREAVEQGLKTGREYYASLPYNLMVRDGLRIKIYDVPQFIQFGTPHDVQIFEYWYQYFRNQRKL
jgi:NDP-sugar pyrophosphorylase family protein